MSEIDIINDYKKTVKRLQQECTEKTDAIIVLGERLHRYKQAVKEIKDIAETCNKTSRCFNCKYFRWCADIDITEGYSYEVVNFILKKCEEVNVL